MSKVNQIIANRSDVSDIIDGKFRNEYTIKVQPKSSFEAVMKNRRMHESAVRNTLWIARSRGLLPRGTPQRESYEIVHTETNPRHGDSVSVRLVYSVPVVLLAA